MTLFALRERQGEDSYIGIASALKLAMKEYTSRDQNNFGEMDVAKIAYTKFREKLEVCRDMLHGYDYSAFNGTSDLARSKAISGAVKVLAQSLISGMVSSVATNDRQSRAFTVS